MADKKEGAKGAEQIYTIPLRDVVDYPKWNRCNRAVKIIREYLARHMKDSSSKKISEDKIKIGASLNEAVWSRGIQKPPARVRVKATLLEDGVVQADLVSSE